MLKGAQPMTMGAHRPICNGAFLLALLALLATPMSTAPTAESCARGCHCSPLAGSDKGAVMANCSSPAAAAALGAGPLGAQVHEIRLTRHNDHLSVKEGAFRSLEGLRSLHLDHLGLVKVYPGAFRGLDHLEELDLSHNALSAGDEVSRALRDLPQLRRLSLRGNNFGSTHGTPLSLVSRTLKFVDLGSCKIRDLPPEVLGGLTHLRHIVIDGNFIRSFKIDAVPRSVVSLDLSNNDIDRISYKELSKLENVDAIELSGNPVYCNCDLLQISRNYNINKPVVCAAPKQLMGKDMLNVKKNQVCGGHKKVKREAGNELDDETLSQENADELDDNMQSKDDMKNDEPETITNEESSKEESEKNNQDIVETEKKREEDKKSVANNEESKKEDTPPMEISGIAEDLDEDGDDAEEGDSGPENIYGEQEIDHIVDTEKNDDVTNTHGDRIVSDDKSEVEDQEEESREELIFTPENKEVPVDEQTDDDYESEKTNDESDTDVVDGEKTAADDIIVGGPTSYDSNLGNSEEHKKKQNFSEDIDNTEDEADDDTLAVNEASEHKKKDDSDDSALRSGNEDKTEDDGDAMSEERNPPESLSPSEYTKLQAFSKEEKKDTDDTKIHGEEEYEEEPRIEDDLPVISDADLNLSEQTGSRTSAEGINTKPEPVVDTEEESISHNDNLLAGNNKEDEKSNEDQHSPNSEVGDENDEVDIQENTDTVVDGSASRPGDHVVETVEDSENVVHTSDVGARVETEDISEPKTEGDDDEGEDSSVDVIPDDDIVDEDPTNSDDGLENSANETEDNEDSDKTIEEPETWEGRALDEGVAVAENKEEEEGAGNSKETGADSDSPSVGDADDGDKILEEELEEDKKHSTLSHSDLIEGKDDENEKESAMEDDDEPVVNNDSLEGLVRHSLDNKNKEDNADKVTGDTEQSKSSMEDTDISSMPDVDDESIEQDYETVKNEGKEEDSPGDRIAAAYDTYDNEEKEGSGAIDNTPVRITSDKESDWTDDNEWKESDNEAVPPLENAESKEEGEDGDSHQSGYKFNDSVDKLKVNTETPTDFLDEGNVTEEGSGIPVNGLLPGKEDDDDTSAESGYGSGGSVPFVNIPEQTETEPNKDEDDDAEESSGQGPFIPVIPGLDDSSNAVEENVFDTDESGVFPAISPNPIVDEDIIPRAKTPVQSAPPRAPVLGRGNISDDAEVDDSNAKEDEKAEDNSAPVNPEVSADVLKPVPAPGDEVDKIEGADGDNGKKHENVLAAVPPSDSASDGSEALNKESALNLNTVGSYIVLGAIMLIVVILLAYAVCRSRRQKSSPTKEKDVENPGREMQDVNKPLINNHHPPAPEKLPLDETQEPLMTKEQEASLSVEPEKTALADIAMDHKPKQNGAVPEVVVERPTGPVANGKAPSPAAVHPTLPAAPPSPTTVSPTAPPTASPAASPPRSPAYSPTAANVSVTPMVNGGTHSPPRPASPEQPPASSPAACQPPVSPGAVRVVAKELPDSVAKRPVIIMNRGAEPAQQV